MEKEEDIEEEGEPIDWENPFDVIRSAEIEGTITVRFLDNGYKLLKMDEKGEYYTQYKWKCERIDISKPAVITLITSSKKLIELIQSEGLKGLVDREFEIGHSGSGFQTKYTLKEV